MTRRVGNTIFIEAEAPDLCEMCGEYDELRPVGPNRERICWNCGQNYPLGTERYIEELFGNIDSIEEVVTTIAQKDWDRTH